MTTDKRTRAETSANTLLMYLHRFGWLTSRMIAALVWPDASQALPLARRNLRKLLDEKLIICRTLPDGGECYLLGVKGARLLQDAEGVSAVSGQNLPLGNALHRACANWCLIKKLQEGFSVWTEYEIQTGRAPFSSFDGKTPDGLIETEEGLVWLEIENAWKNRKERQKIVTLAERYLGGVTQTRLASGAFLFRLLVVSTNEDALRYMVSSFRESWQLGYLSESQSSDVWLGHLPINKSLVAGELSQWSLLHDVLNAEFPSPDPTLEVVY